ncbi:uncharacterized protein LOC34619823 [Cyclospora cayetanensis]|uniref:Uncharacterized protein LOC34619823 n=2 Tax=Cyclospora cayetanensis TaxID=88456 RepID=A0A6P5WDX5_9EIME|nr:uncharacterized protein LOC34619823 [Cyclospora cayetanensis]OEH78702.1 hypothetical protein cyc_03068 [Cyclospora cayetanensis]
MRLPKGQAGTSSGSPASRASADTTGASKAPEGSSPHSTDPPASPGGEGPNLSLLVAKTEVLAHLLKARVALPLLYPLNTRGLTDPLQPSPIASNRWKREDILLGLSQVAPLALSLSRVGGLLRAAQALKLMGPPAGATGALTVPKRASLRRKQTYRDTNHFLRPQVWRVLKPGEERATKHLRWR